MTRVRRYIAIICCCMGTAMLYTVIFQDGLCNYEFTRELTFCQYVGKETHSRNIESLPLASGKDAAEDEVLEPWGTCGEECILVKNTLNSWPTDKPKAVIYYLVKKIPFPLINSLQMLFQRFNNEYRYPVLIFHEGLEGEQINFIKERVGKMYKGCKVDDIELLYFQKVKFEMPTFVDISKVPMHMNTSCHRDVGYRHMCRFQSKLVYQHPAMKGFDWAWRLDDDSRIVTPITYDLFKYMETNNKVYGYHTMATDHPDCVKELRSETDVYIKKHHIKTNFFYESIPREIFFTNFEISKLSFWFGKEYQHFIEHVDTLGGIYYYRWGDAPIKTTAVSMFLKKEQLVHFLDVGYRHKDQPNQ